MFCIHCGKEIADGAKFCNFCGKSQESNSQTLASTTESTSSMTSGTVAASAQKKKKKRKLPLIGGIAIGLIALVMLISGGSDDAGNSSDKATPEVSDSDTQQSSSPQSSDTNSTDSSNESDDYTPTGSPLDDFVINGYTYQEALAQGWGDEFEALASGGGTDGVDWDEGIDPALIGRWAAYDGGTLEFTDAGCITNINFRCWRTTVRNPDRIEWSVENGRVNCVSYFDYSYPYKFTEDGKGRVWINDVLFRPADGADNSGLIGNWIDHNYGVTTLQLNEDGTGMYEGYPITWYTSPTIDGSTDVFYYTMKDNGYFDYQVDGNLLTVFLSDGSKVYTKVGN